MHQQWADMPAVVLTNIPYPTTGTHLNCLRATQQEARQ